MIKRMIIMLVAVGVIVGGMIGFKYMMATGTKKAMASMPMEAQTVSTMKAGKLDWQQEATSVGTLRAVNGADLSSEVSGIVEELSFDSDSDIEAGAALVRLRDADALAQLRALEAAAHLAQVTLDRDLKQLKGQAISQAAVDNDKAALESAKAQADAQRAIVEKRTIRAPFKGHLGIRQVDLGQFLEAGKTIVTLQQLDPIYIDFNVPEQDLPKIAVGQKITARADAFPGISFDGEIYALNAKVDEATRNVQIRATFKNPDRKLLPGMFAHVTVTTGEPIKQITLPQTAITYNPYGDTVYVATKNDKGAIVAIQTFVKLGAARGDQVAIVSGIKEGDEVVTSGQLKLRNGTPLVVNNEIQPTNDENPKPIDK
ncbi:MAG: efflux RND transporter periplasmic adaptor subunit [Bdellovibrionales bacterium]